MLTTVVAGRVYNFSHAVGQSLTSGAGFHFPTAVAIAKDGVVYVANRSDESNISPRVSKITIGAPEEEEFICEFGTYGDADGEFIWTSSLALDRDENVYVADESLHRISIFDKHGNFLDKWGTFGAGNGELNRPSGMAFDQEDNLYIVDSMNNRVQQFTKDGTFLAKFGEEGSEEGQFSLPWSITIDSQGDVYVADWQNHRVQKFSPDGTFLTNIGTYGTGVGELNYPSDMAIDHEGDVYVCDRANDRVQIFGPEGEFITSLNGDAQQLSKWAKQRVADNPDIQKARRRVKNLEQEWRFSFPTGVAFDEAKDRLIVSDCCRCRLQIYIKDKNYVDP